MKRVTFSLPTGADQADFERAVALLRKALAAGWSLQACETAYVGGLPGGRFVLGLGADQESIEFRLSDAGYAGFGDALGEIRSLPEAERSWLGAEIGDEGGRGVLLIGEASRTRVVKKSRSAAARTSVLKGMRAAGEGRPSIYDLTEAAALKGLRAGRGEEADQVRALMGPEYFELLSDMARRAEAGPSTRAKKLGKALVLPGIMGSKLGTQKSFLGLANYDDVIWLDPVDMRRGRLADLALGSGGKPRKGTQSVGVLYSFYLRLKLSLSLAGFDADFYHYDWRRPIRDLGAEFAAFLNRQKEPVTLVAHSMGGIVSRAALRAGARDEKVKRLIMIGTPNHGSFVPAQALRAAYPFLKTLAVTFDRDLDTVTDEVFSTFAGLYDLLPAPEVFRDYPIFDAAKWPKSKPRPNREYLEAAMIAQSLLAPADERFHLICGVDQDTVVGVKLEGDEFVFLQSKDGDGTVPRESAELPNCPTLYVKGSHGMLPNYGIVCDLALDLAREGRTGRATIPWTKPQAPMEEVRESSLRRAADIPGLTRGVEPSPEAVRAILEPILALPPLDRTEAGEGSESPGSPLPVGGSGMSGKGGLFTEQLNGVVLGRHHQRQLEVAIFPGSLTDLPSRAYVLGLFQGVAPAGAARAVDQRMGNAVNDFVQRRMLSGRLGEVFIMPKGRSFILADHVIFVGLGPFDRFRKTASGEDGVSGRDGSEGVEACPGTEGGGDTMRLVCESIIRTCLHANVEEFATILLGGSAAERTGDAIAVFTRSFLDALKVADPQRRLRKVTLCENDPQRVVELRTELIRLATTDLFEDVELELRDLPAPTVPAPSRAAVIVERRERPTPIYLLTRMYMPSTSGSAGAGRAPGVMTLETSLLLPKSKGAILTERCPVPESIKKALVGKIGQGGFSGTVLEEIGRDLVAIAFSDKMRLALADLAKNYRDRPMVVVHDPVASQLPWETFRFEDWRPAIEGGVSRQHLDANLSVAKWLEERAVQPTLEVLLVTNPTEDLDGAEREGNMVRELLSKVANVSLTERRGPQATRRQLLADFRTGRFDMIHYAGHAFFSPDHPGRSGLLCAGQEVLSGVDVAALSNLPSLIFFNACEAARIRGGKAPDGSASSKRPAKMGKDSAKTPPGSDPVENLSVAAALIRGGVANFLGTYWPVGDTAAETFSRTFYKLLVEGQSIGDAVREGRRSVKNENSSDWANYILYGNVDFVLKRRPSGSGSSADPLA